MNILPEALTFNDVLIVPSHSDIDSRSEISLSQTFMGLQIDLPIISANMDYVTEAKMANAMRKNGGLGIFHRFYTDMQRLIDEMPIVESPPIICSIGTRKLENSLAAIDDIIGRFVFKLDGVCIDVAHGDHQKVIGAITKIKTIYPNLFVVAGNVATGTGYLRLAAAGADAIKVGIGPGSVCTTREVTGIGVPQLSAIMSVVEARRMRYGTEGPSIIADGGIKNSGDIVKALAAGADLVMLGSLLAGADECPGAARVSPDNSRWRPFRGQSIFGTNGDKFVPEGIAGWVQEKGPVSEILQKLAGGIRSGMSYVGARNLTELRENAQFIKVSHSTHIESGTRI